MTMQLHQNKLSTHPQSGLSGKDLLNTHNRSHCLVFPANYSA